MKNKKAIYGAAFLMATSAIGPGFLTATVLFTNQLGASFAFVIVASTIIDLIVQSNIWQIIALAKQPAQVIANNYFNGAGHLISILIIFGGFVFNMGNIAGCGLGLSSLFNISPLTASIVSALIAIAIFMYKQAGVLMDIFTKALGALMILLMAFIMIKTEPPFVNILKESIFPSQINLLSIITIVGGTVGGYISFAGAHRLLQQGITGKENIAQVKQSANTAISIASIMRILLFAAALGAINKGVIINKDNPAASVFQSSIGTIGLQLFGIVIWAASLTSVIGASFTSITFATHWHSSIKKNQNLAVVLFILSSTIIYILFGKPVQVLLFAGSINALVLAIALIILLLATYAKIKQNQYNKSWWIAGFICAAILLIAGIFSFINTYIKF